MSKTPLDELFHPNESPYMNMYVAGLMGWELEEIAQHLSSIDVPLRSKDVKNWENGIYRHRTKIITEGGHKSILNPFVPSAHIEHQAKPQKYSEFSVMPKEWVGCEQRFFPCTSENKPMTKWGWTKNFTPTLYDYASAKALSPCGWVGQNMIYQKFIVLDIDGVGHGCTDQYVIAFGNMFKDKTLCLEDPKKPGSFHLYFKTDRLIPVRHFPWAKLDVMGNMTNAAVYLKNKQPNNLPMAVLTEEIWNLIMQYAEYRKENKL